MNGRSVLLPRSKLLAVDASAAKESARRLGAPQLYRWCGAVDLDALALVRAAQDLGVRYFYWLSADRSETIFGAGEALRVRGQGAGRFREVAQFHEAHKPALLVGAFAWGSENPAADDGWFVPQVGLRLWHGGRLDLTLTGAADAAGGFGSSSAKDPIAPLRLLTRLMEPRSPRPIPRSVAFEPPGARARWQALVERAKDAIDRGELEKVVLARQSLILLEESPDVASVLERLASTQPNCSVFAVHHGGQTFLGASPERLVRVDGDAARVDCLAGSWPRGRDATSDDAAGQGLLGSDKNAREHRMVVAAVMRELQAAGLDPYAPTAPELVRLRDVQHLFTPVQASLPQGVGIFHVAQALHPTPAVGGTPRDAALRFIARQEGSWRGLYGGALGWVDRQGNGELDVGIRSALLRGRAARLFAGCGIVAGSAPDEEFRETRLKLRAMRAALGGRSD